jgi:2-methylcitrate dehydratase PrpD
MSSGLLAFLNQGVQTKPIHPAWAAHGGVIAARLAAHGAEGPADVLDGRYGLYDAFIGDGAGVCEQFSDFGERWETLEISYKPFPACHFMHGSLTATTALLDQVDAGEIDRIWVTVPESAVAVICEPALEKMTPRTDYEGKFSVQYSTASLLVNGRLNLGTYSAESRADPVVRELARRVSYEVKSYGEGGSFPGATRILTTDGRVLAAERRYQLGARENPMSAEQVRSKFRDNASSALDSAAVEDLEERICSLELQDDLESVFGLLAKRAVAV